MNIDSKKNKQLLKYFLVYFNWALVLATVVIAVYYSYQSNYLRFLPLAKFSGNLSAIFFCISLIPGILNRFKVKNQFLKSISNLLLFSRAHIGSSMFLLAQIHYLLHAILPLFFLEGFMLGFFPYEIAGLTAFYLSLPLFLTSNMYSKKILKKWWTKLHRLTYLILWAIFLHVALVGANIISLVIGLTGALHLASLMFAYFQKQTRFKA